jgi:hypothetical protein
MWEFTRNHTYPQRITAKHSIRAGYKLSNETSPPEGLSVGVIVVNFLSVVPVLQQK